MGAGRLSAMIRDASDFTTWEKKVFGYIFRSSFVDRNFKEYMSCGLGDTFLKSYLHVVFLFTGFMMGDLTILLRLTFKE